MLLEEISQTNECDSKFMVSTLRTAQQFLSNSLAGSSFALHSGNSKISSYFLNTLLISLSSLYVKDPGFLFHHENWGYLAWTPCLQTYKPIFISFHILSSPLPAVVHDIVFKNADSVTKLPFPNLDFLSCNMKAIMVSCEN